MWKKRRVLNTKLLLHNRRLYLVLCLVTSNDLCRRRAGLSASAEILVSVTKQDNNTGNLSEI